LPLLALEVLALMDHARLNGAAGEWGFFLAIA
jgi:hypothetical protein